MLIVPQTDIQAGTTKIYNARGTAAHDHFIEVTSADFAALKAGMVVKKKACNAEDHEIWLSCGVPEGMPAAPTCADECGAMQNMLCAYP
jgi:hypothetical protein